MRRARHENIPCFCNLDLIITSENFQRKILLKSRYSKICVVGHEVELKLAYLNRKIIIIVQKIWFVLRGLP